MAVTEAQVRAHLEPEEPNYKAAAALGADALPVLERLVQDADPLLASKAAYLASLIPDDRAARVLEQAARSEHPTVRVAAAAGLQKRPEVSDEVVIDLIADPDQGVRKVALKATRGRMTARLRDRVAARASKEQNPARRAAFSAALEGVVAAQPAIEDHGGGPSPERKADAERAAGEGGGDLGEASARSSVAPSGEEESDGGGGGDLGVGAGARAGRAPDGPDGGGFVEAESSGDAEISPHGGGQI